MAAKISKLGIGYLGIIGVYTLYSYSLVDPNLVLSSQPTLWKWQNLIWRLGYQERLWSSLIYVLLISLLFLVYFGIIGQLDSGLGKFNRSLKKILAAAILILFFSYPALSHDIYNYLFNAKMVMVYHANPHVQVAMDFPNDPMLKFMNNVHTPAPYAYGWTAMSLIPYALGLGHLKITIVIFRLVMIAALLILLMGQRKLIYGQKLKWWWAFALNPLVLIETVSNIHNDAVMMALAIWAVICFKKAKLNKSWWVPGLLLLGLSMTVKYATVMLVLGAGIWWLGRKYHKNWSFGGSQAVANFLPLLTARSQRFLPWYLMWPLTFLPMIREKILRETLVLFSLSALLSYIPYLYTGEYTPASQLLRQIILFVPPISFALSRWWFSRKTRPI